MRLLFGAVFILFISVSNAQDTTAITAQEAVESILTNSADEQDVQHLGEELEYLYEHPINISKPNYNDLVRLPFISPMLAEAIVYYTDTVHVVATEQLLNIPLLSQETYKQLLPFITVELSDNLTTLNHFLPQDITSRTRYERRLQIAKGYSDGTFQGESYSSYQRIRIKNDNVELAGLFEKDAGELYDDGLTAGYLSIKEISAIDQVVIGNFNITSGQGLIFAKNIATTKGSNVIGQTKKRGNVISPSVSTDEYRYFQGAAANANLYNVSVLGFFSERKLPASADSTGMITSFFTSGVYRTANDVMKMNVLNEQVFGSLFRYSLDPVKTISLAFMNVEYDKSISKSIFDMRNSKSIRAGSFSWELPFQSFNLFGEVASNEAIRFSKILGIIVPLSKNISVSYHYRGYTKGFISPFARPFGERDMISDGESGNYVGAEIKFKSLVLNAYADNYYLPSTTTQFGAAGREMFVHGLYSLSTDTKITLQIRNKIRSQTQIVYDQRAQTNYRISYSQRVTREFSFTHRLEVVNVTYQPTRYKEKGFLTFVEGVFKQRAIGLDMKTRIVFFDTDSYDSRLYQYESDVAGNFSNPPMYGNGFRWYFILGYEILKNFRLSMKYSETKKLHEHVIGSGDDEITGNIDNHIAVQLDFEM